MWAFVRDEYFDEAYSFMIDDNMSDELVEKITYYHENVGSRTDEILSQAKESGVEIAICSHYDKGAVPLTEQACREGDSLIETVCTSNGATVAPSGKTLGEALTATLRQRIAKGTTICRQITKSTRRPVFSPTALGLSRAQAMSGVNTALIILSLSNGLSVQRTRMFLPTKHILSLCRPIIPR